MGGRRLLSVVAAALIGLVALLGLGSSVSASTQPPYPVVWSFLATAVVAGAQNGPDVPPPGADVPGCKPSAAHPDPVVLVHGLGGDANDNWQTLSPFLADHGYCVYALTYGNDTSEPRPFDQIGGLADMQASAGQLSGFVQQVLAATGAAKVDMVGHSEGGTMPDYYIKFDGGYRYVARFVTMSGVLHGTTFWGLDALYAQGEAYGYSQQFTAPMAKYCTACFEFFPTSPFIEAVDNPAAPGAAPSCAADGASVDGVQYTSIATAADELVRPPTSDFIDPACGNSDDILLQHQCPTDAADHLSIVSDPVAAQDVLRALDPSDDKPVRCAVVLPAVG